MNYETINDFCQGQGELQYLCREFNCDEYENIYTKEQAEYLSDAYDEYRLMKEGANQEVYEINTD